MTKGRKRRCSTRKLTLSILMAIVFFTLGYHLVVFCVLDRIAEIPVTQTRPSVNMHSINVDKSGNPNGFDRIHADRVLHELAGFRQSDIDDIIDNKVVNTVHFVWCKPEPFPFTTYLSILSVWKIMQPDMIEVHLQQPNMTEDKYNDWLTDLKKMVPGLVVKQLPQYWDGDEHGCGLWFGLALIDDRGGIHVGDNILVTETILPYRKVDHTILSYTDGHNKSHVAVAMTTDHNSDFRTSKQTFQRTSQSFPKEQTKCGRVNKDYNKNMSFPCYLIEGALTPVDFFMLDTPFGKFVRRLIYGSERVVKSKQFLPGTIPKIVHYVWFGIKEMDFLMYLSMLSTLFIVNPEKVLIHWDGGLKGRYFDRILKDKRVVLVMRERPFNIYGHKVLYSQHRSDIVRAECLLKHGGIYMDWDVLWLRNPDDVIATGYDAIANFDHMAQGNFPDAINLGVLMAKPRSTFIKRWQDALYNYKSKDFLYNAVELPYKIYEKYPEYLYIERRLK